MMQKLLFLLIISVTGYYSIELGDSCLSPDNLIGECTLMKDCPGLLKLYNEDASPQTFEYIKTFKCPVEFPGGKRMAVCCVDNCVDPNKKAGACISIEDCEAVKKMTVPPISPDSRAFLQKSQCQFKNKTPWVCCAASTEPNAVPIGSRIEEITEPPTTERIITTRPATTTKRVRTTTERTSTAPPVAPDAMSPIEREIEKKLSEGLIFKSPSCGQKSSDRIVGGEQTVLDEFPWLALIGYTKPEDEFGFHCGGSLINNRYVLTAAHCVEKIPDTWTLSKVRLGEWDLEKDPDCYENSDVCAPKVQDIGVASPIIVHEDYNKRLRDTHNDIALLRLKKRAVFTDYVDPICLPLDPTLWNSMDYTNSRFEASGWGKTENITKSSIKLKVDLPFFLLEDCQDSYQAQGRVIDETQICAGGEKGKDSCNGDSGGPLMAWNRLGVPYYYLVGIVSYGAAQCGTEGTAGVYTRVSEYLPWILKNLKK